MDNLRVVLDRSTDCAGGCARLAGSTRVEFTVAIDGPAAAGKGTIARAVAASLGFAHLDTGLLYRAVAVQALDDGRGVIDPHWAAELARRLAPGGLLILSTPNQTSWSKLLTITLAEGFGRIPKGTHDYDKFITPERMKVLIADAGLKCVDFEGIGWNPMQGLHLTDNLSLNYLVAAVCGEAGAD